MLASNKLQNKNPYYVENEVLKRFIDDNKQRFEVHCVTTNTNRTRIYNWHMKG